MGYPSRKGQNVILRSRAATPTTGPGGKVVPSWLQRAGSLNGVWVGALSRELKGWVDPQWPCKQVHPNKEDGS